MSNTPTKHRWELENIDGGAIGDADFWHCGVCGASGGVCWDPMNRPPKHFFLAGSNPMLKLPDDCAEAKRLIDEYKAKTKKLTINVDGDEHTIGGDCCRHIGNCSKCGGKLHYQAMYGSYWQACEVCDLSEWTKK